MAALNIVWEISGVAKLGGGKYAEKTVLYVTENIMDAVQVGMDLMEVVSIKSLGELFKPITPAVK